MPKTSARETEKVTLSLPRDLVDFADRAAKARGVSRSQVVAEVLSAAADAERDRLAAEGYRFYAEENRAFADSSWSAVAEAWEKGS